MTRAPFTRAPLPSLEPKGYRQHFCHCGRFGAFGVRDTWRCELHRPADFMPKDRA